MKPEFYYKDGVHYCKMKIAGKDIDAPVTTVLDIMGGLGILLLAAFVWALAEDIERNKTTIS